MSEFKKRHDLSRAEALAPDDRAPEGTGVVLRVFGPKGKVSAIHYLTDNAGYALALQVKQVLRARP